MQEQPGEHVPCAPGKGSPQGTVGEDRLLPDAMLAWAAKRPAEDTQEFEHWKAAMPGPKRARV